MIRRATPADVDGIARVHVQAWRESYPGLMPQAAIEAGLAEPSAHRLVEAACRRVAGQDPEPGRGEISCPELAEQRTEKLAADAAALDRVEQIERRNLATRRQAAPQDAAAGDKAGNHTIVFDHEGRTVQAVQRVLPLPDPQLDRTRIDCGRRHQLPIAFPPGLHMHARDRFDIRRRGAANQSFSSRNEERNGCAG